MAEINLGSLYSKLRLDIGTFQANAKAALATYAKLQAAQAAQLRTQVQAQAAAIQSQAKWQAAQIRGTSTTQSVTQSLAHAGAQIKNVGSNMRQAGYGLTLGLTTPIVGLGSAVLRSSIQFEDAFTGIKRTTEATPEQFNAIRESILALSQQIPVTAVDLAQIGEIGGQLNISPDAMMPFIETVARLGSTTKLSFEAAGTTLGKFSSLLQMPQADFERFGSTLSRIGDITIGDERSVANLASQLVGAGRVANMTAADIIGLAGGLTQLGIRPERAGTAFSKVINDMGTAVLTGGVELQMFAETAGVSAEQFAATWRGNAADAVLLFVSGLQTLFAEGANVAPRLDDLGFSAARTGDTLRRAAVAGDTMSSILARARQEWQENVKLQQESALRFGTTSSQMQVAANKANVVAIALGDQLTPMLIEVLNGLSPLLEALHRMVQWFTALDPTTKRVLATMAVLAAGIGPVVIVLGSLLSAIGSVVTIMGSAGLATAIGGLVTLLTGPVGLSVAIGTVLVGAIGYGITSMRAWQSELTTATQKAATFHEQVALMNKAMPGSGGALQALDAQIARTIDPAARKKLEASRDAMVKAAQGGATPLQPGMTVQIKPLFETKGGKTPYEDLFREASQKYRVDMALLQAMARQESQFNAQAVSKAGAQGIMQLMPGTAKDLKVTDPLDPRQSIMGGADYMSQMLERYQGNVQEALAAYNAGMGKVKPGGGVPNIAETKDYVEKVLAYQKQFASGAAFVATTPKITTMPDAAELRETAQVAKQELQAQLAAQAAQQQLGEANLALLVEQARQSGDLVALAERESAMDQLRVTHKQEQIQLESALKAEQLASGKITDLSDRARLEGDLKELGIQQQLVLSEQQLVTLKNQHAIAQAKIAQESQQLERSASVIRDATAGAAAVLEAQTSTAVNLLEQQHALALRNLDVQGASEDTINLTRHQQALGIAQIRYETEQKIYDIRLASLQAEVANLTAQQQLATTEQERLQIAGELLRKNYEVQALQAAPPIKTTVIQPLTAQQQAAARVPQELAQALTSGVQDLLTAFTEGGAKIGTTIQNMGKTILETSLKPLMAQIQESIQKLISGLGSVGPWAGAALGVAMVAIGGIFNKQKAEVESLGEGVKNNIESVERTRGLIAGDQSIAIAQLSDNLSMAFRPTNEILLRMEAVLRAIYGGGPVPGATGATMQQYYAQELIGSVRLG